MPKAKDDVHRHFEEKIETYFSNADGKEGSNNDGSAGEPKSRTIKTCIYCRYTCVFRNTEQLRIHLSAPSTGAGATTGCKNVPTDVRDRYRAIVAEFNDARTKKIASKVAITHLGLPGRNNKKPGAGGGNKQSKRKREDGDDGRTATANQNQRRRPLPASIRNLLADVAANEAGDDDGNENSETLSLSNKGLGDEGAKNVADALVTNTTVTTLELDRNGITEVGMATLARSLVPHGGGGGGHRPRHRVRSVNLDCNSAGDAGSAALAGASLAAADDDDADDDADADAAPDGGGGGGVEEIHLAGNDVGDDGAVAFAEALRGGVVAGRRCTLTALGLGSNRIGRRGAEALLDVLRGGGDLAGGGAGEGNRTLTWLDLSDNPDVDEELRGEIEGFVAANEALGRRLKRRGGSVSRSIGARSGASDNVAATATATTATTDGGGAISATDDGDGEKGNCGATEGAEGGDGLRPSKSESNELERVKRELDEQARAGEALRASLAEALGANRRLEAKMCKLRREVGKAARTLATLSR